MERIKEGKIKGREMECVRERRKQRTSLKEKEIIEIGRRQTKQRRR